MRKAIFFKNSKKSRPTGPNFKDRTLYNQIKLDFRHYLMHPQIEKNKGGMEWKQEKRDIKKNTEI